MLASTAFVCFLGAVNVAEVALVRDALGGSSAELSLVVSAMALGLALGSLVGGRATTPARCRRTYLGGLGICAMAMLACALAPAVQLAVPAFLALGFGNGLALTAETVLVQLVLPGC